MKKRLFPVLLFVLFSCLLTGWSLPLTAQPATEEENLRNLLTAFLDGASENSIEMHDRFWAEDLIYTSSSGERYGKETIMNSLRSAEPDEDAPSATYSAEDVQINIFGEVAVLAFRLVGETTTAEGSEVSYYLNSGTFLLRNGEWKAVIWQATKVPESN